MMLDAKYQRSVIIESDLDELSYPYLNWAEKSTEPVVVRFCYLCKILLGKQQKKIIQMP